MIVVMDMMRMIMMLMMIILIIIIIEGELEYAKEVVHNAIAHYPLTDVQPVSKQ